MNIADVLRHNQPDVYAILMAMCGWPDMHEAEEEELKELEALMKEIPRGRDDGKKA